ncbi:hypothetical protein F7725_022243 [Dissostichus mawsoni]|uniref:Uncharacterized protein n=1 Tax=Dissostichus mawsoni TaxID=36200 RepID=A0A7J5Z1K1_DISMA|nr:hypothetical protein F7725_022243 [Dissostichus mawsoni]
MASKQLNEWLEAGKALADELANKAKTKEKNARIKCFLEEEGPGWEHSTQHTNKNRSVKPSSSQESPEVEETHEIPLQVPSLDTEKPVGFSHCPCIIRRNTHCINMDPKRVETEAMIDGFYRPIPPTSLVVVDESGQYGLCEQVCLLPIPPPSQICFFPSQDFTIIPGKQTVLVTINGPYNVCLPSVCCPICSTKWSLSIGDLLGYKYWPATSSCKIIFKFDVFTSFEQMK